MGRLSSSSSVQEMNVLVTVVSLLFLVTNTMVIANWRLRTDEADAKMATWTQDEAKGHFLIGVFAITNIMLQCLYMMAYIIYLFGTNVDADGQKRTGTLTVKQSNVFLGLLFFLIDFNMIVVYFVTYFHRSFIYGEESLPTINTN